MRTTKPARLLGVGGDLGHQLVGADADRDAQAGGLADLGHQPAHRRARGDEAREVGVGLVEADDLDAVELLAHDPHHRPGDLAVGVEVGRDDDRLGAQPPGPRRRHGGADAEAPRLVGGGGDDRARPAAGDDHRQAPQLRAALQLDRRVERVEVEVGDAAGHPPRVRPAPDGAAALSG